MNKQEFYAALAANNLNHHSAHVEPLMNDTIRYNLTFIARRCAYQITPKKADASAS
jgi:hypothetical protein